MASSSSSAPSSQSPKKYDVFISFRGEDTRFNFTSHLHEALRRNQIYTYIDYRLEKGDEVWPSLEKAIKDSTLFLVVFSENYASSTWCLKELAKILECSKNQGCFVVPVFYRVDPSHVRKQSGSYKKAFEEHECKRNINNQQLQRWREALTQAANLCGWHCGFNRDEAELIEEIVNRVMQKLGPRYQSEYYLKGLIGIHKRMADVESLLDKGSNNGGCQFIGIWGMGGLGKTALAEALFNKLFFTYEGSCFLNVMEESKKYGMDALRREFLWRLLGDKESHIGNAIYPHTISRLRRKKVLIVLDDVNDRAQLENLVGRLEFGPGTKILITTRDKQVLGKEVDDIYALHGLDPDEAFQLFSLNAFKKGYSDPKISELAKKVIEYAGGNPLALKGSIEGMIMDLSEVEETGVIIKAFRSMPNLKFLRVYGNLNVQLRNKLNASGMMFLSKNLMLLDWVGCPLKTLPTTFKGENLVEIDMPFSKLTKLWDGEQNLVNLSRIDLRGSQDLIELPNFSKAIHLVRVTLDYCTKLQNVHPSILSLHSLSCLELTDCKTLASLTSNTHLKSLCILKLTGCSGLSEFSVTSEKYWIRLSLHDAAINGELCSSSGHLSRIGVLDLGRCESVTSLHKLVDMRTLERLDADYCNKLASNLCSKFDEMRALHFLRLTNCSELYEVPDNISLLASLNLLNLSWSNIETLPLSIKHLSSLQRLFFKGCKRLRSLPQLPPSISLLDVNNCLSLETLHVPLMSVHLPLIEDRGDLLYYEEFSFRNCMKLDGQSIKAVEARVLLAINNNKAIYFQANMEYPGRRVAEWVMYRTTQSFLTVDLSSIPQPWDGGFIFCAVISGSSWWTNITAELFIDGQHASTFEHYSLGEYLLSDHVVLWYDQRQCREVQGKIEEKKIEAQSNTSYHPLLQFEFAAFSRDETTVEIKEWGVCPTSAVEYQNYIKQIQLALLHCKSASRKRKYHSLLR
ncbi:disease resistance protein RPP2A-like [Neltuma alba]|uniref:disease resistance protein RPP2A-like n=1 Tax=Neltuma alba TaxID=207710 RepID=UPI0010A3E3B6|nr:disease resistance protein RPP2A-like [Prosopis alba]